jgi:hypothetical protein
MRRRRRPPWSRCRRPGRRSSRLAEWRAASRPRRSRRRTGRQRAEAAGQAVELGIRSALRLERTQPRGDLVGVRRAAACGEARKGPAGSDGSTCARAQGRRSRRRARPGAGLRGSRGSRPMQRRESPRRSIRARPATRPRRASRGLPQTLDRSTGRPFIGRIVWISRREPAYTTHFRGTNASRPLEARRDLRRITSLRRHRRRRGPGR